MPLAAADKPRSLSPVALRLWDKLVPELEKLGLATVLDGPSLEVLCETYAFWMEARSALSEGDLLIRQRTNQGRVSNPLWRIVRDSAADFIRFGEAFGLTPSSRARFNFPEPDPWDELEAGFEKWSAERAKTRAEQ